MRVPSLTTRYDWTGKSFYLIELNLCDTDQNAKAAFPPENTRVFEFGSTYNIKAVSGFPQEVP